VKLSIRAATHEDRTFIETLGKRTVMDSVSAVRHPDPGEVVENFERLLRIVDSREHLHTLPDEVTGVDQAFIAYMAVARERRAKGIGAALLAAAEDEARRLGMPYMAMMVTEDNASARALYDRAGYLTERRLLCKML
jgi:ribosomal protein S18 acetylase RimI-like enzyme